MNINVDLDQATDFECEKCKDVFFSTLFRFKRLSALVSPTGEEVMIPIQLLKCDSCGHINVPPQ
jgi:hypothetical protein